jgi:hypothetical protein
VPVLNLEKAKFLLVFPMMIGLLPFCTKLKFYNINKYFILKFILYLLKYNHNI